MCSEDDTHSGSACAQRTAQCVYMLSNMIHAVDLCVLGGRRAVDLLVVGGSVSQ